MTVMIHLSITVSFKIPYSNVCAQYFHRTLAQPFTTFASAITFGHRIPLKPREGKDISTNYRVIYRLCALILRTKCEFV